MRFSSFLSLYQRVTVGFALLLFVGAGALFLIGNRGDSVTAEVTAVAALSNQTATTKEVKVRAEHDSDKGLNITRLDDSVKFADYLSCLHKDYLKSYPQYPGILSKNNSCINKRMQHDILLKKLATAEGSARFAKDKADMVQEALDYASAHEKDENVDLSILFLFKGIDDTAYYEKASFSPQCLIQGSEKYGPKFAGMLKPKGDSSSAFVDSTPATQARKVKFLKGLEELYNKGEELSKGNIFAFLKNPFKPSGLELFIGVLPESAEKRGYKMNDSLLKRSDVIGTMNLNFYKGACKNPKEVFRFNLGVSWYAQGIPKAVSFPPGNLNTCLTSEDKDSYLKDMKEMMSDNLKELRNIQAKYEKQAVAYATTMKKLEEGDPECFNLPASGGTATSEETKPPAAPVKSSSAPAPYQGYAPSSESGPMAKSVVVEIKSPPGVPSSIGEQAPYISSITPKEPSMDTRLTITGVRFGEQNNQVTVGSATFILPAGDNGTTISFIPKDIVGVVAGRQRLFVTNMKMAENIGRSNVYYINLKESFRVYNIAPVPGARSY